MHSYLYASKERRSRLSNDELIQDVNTIDVVASLQIGNNSIRDRIITNTTIYEVQNRMQYTVSATALVQILDYEFSGVSLDEKDLQQISVSVSAFIGYSDKNKIIIFANWYLKSLGFEQVDSFIAKWIALETLCMKNSSNIAPVKELLGKIYGQTNEDVSQNFGIGRIYSLRNEVVHNGHLIEFEPLFLEYMNLIIQDCLNENLVVPSRKLAERFLSTRAIDINTYINKVRQKYVP